MNSIINFVLKNKFAVWLMTIIVTVAGLYAGLNMKQESIPDVNMPYLSINTTYPGAPRAKWLMMSQSRLNKRCKTLTACTL